MGFFSWKDCVTGSQIKVGEYKKVYLLVPRAFRNKYGVRIGESCYDGYGRFGGYDLFELIAEWNRAYLTTGMQGKLPELSEYGGLESYEKAALKNKGLSDEEISVMDAKKQHEYFENAVAEWQRIDTLMNLYSYGADDEYLTKEFGEDFLSDIGSAITGSYDTDVALKYPVKITYDGTAIYEQCGSSERDNEQGF